MEAERRRQTHVQTDSAAARCVCHERDKLEHDIFDHPFDTTMWLYADGAMTVDHHKFRVVKGLASPRRPAVKDS